MVSLYCTAVGSGIFKGITFSHIGKIPNGWAITRLRHLSTRTPPWARVRHPHRNFLRSFFMSRPFFILAVGLAFGPLGAIAQAADVKILTAGAMKAVVLELVPAFEKETGHKAVVDNDTAGGLSKRILG